MRVDRLTLQPHAGHVTLSARVQAAGTGPTEVWFRVPDSEAPYLQARGDPFLAALLPAAMVEGRGLQIDAPVSPQLRRAGSTLQSILAAWVPEARRIDIEAPESVPPIGSGGLASFFSAGVDSFHTLLAREAQPDPAERVSHLISVEGFDLHPDQPALLRQCRDTVNRVAEAVGTPVVHVATNLRTLSDTYVSWDYQHGAALASVALLLPGRFARVLISATHWYGYLKPWGSHPLLDPLWSTEATRILHEGTDVPRVKKVLDTLARSPLALENLRVCWENRDGAFNCGRCEKCIRTLLALHAAGVLERCRTFSTPLTPALVDTLTFKAPDLYWHARGNLQALESKTDRLSRQLARSLRRRMRHYRLRMAWNVIRGRFMVVH